MRLVPFGLRGALPTLVDLSPGFSAAPATISPVMGMPPGMAARRGRMASVGLATLAIALALRQPAAAHMRSVLRPAEHCGSGPGTASSDLCNPPKGRMQHAPTSESTLPPWNPRRQATGTAVPGAPPDRSRHCLPSPHALCPAGTAPPPPRQGVGEQRLLPMGFLRRRGPFARRAQRAPGSGALLYIYNEKNEG